jgi:hydrogenase-1 operon protein HyaF
MTDLPFPIPVRVIGPGSQPAEDDGLQVLDMPREMATFRMPSVPQDAGAHPLREARDALASLARELERWAPADQPDGPRLDLAGMGADAVAVVNQMLGEGEVSIRVDGARTLRIQESVFTGIWRVCAHDSGGALVADWIEVAPIPRVVAEAAREAASTTLGATDFPPGAMNSPALVAEIRARMRAQPPGGTAHVVNLTLFPMTPDDHRVLDAALPVGPVAIMSRGFGNCRITSTLARDVWRVQYFNSMNTLILNTIEIVAMPEVALAAEEDLADSRERLADLVAWMEEGANGSG